MAQIVQTNSAATFPKWLWRGAKSSLAMSMLRWLESVLSQGERRQRFFAVSFVLASALSASVGLGLVMLTNIQVTGLLIFIGGVLIFIQSLCWLRLVFIDQAIHRNRTGWFFIICVACALPLMVVLSINRNLPMDMEVPLGLFVAGLVVIATVLWLPGVDSDNLPPMT